MLPGLHAVGFKKNTYTYNIQSQPHLHGSLNNHIINLGLHHFQIQDTAPEIYQNNFLEIYDQYTVIPIFTPMVLGLNDRVASAVVYNDTIEIACLADGFTILT